MTRGIAICLVVMMSACAVDPGDDADPAQETTEAVRPAPDAVKPDTTEAARPSPDASKPDACKLAEQMDHSKLAVQSCLLGGPVSDAGILAPSPTGPATTLACNTYYGTCSGANGCSRANGEGWSLTNCGSFLYSWMTICDGQPSGWGTGFCFF